MGCWKRFPNYFRSEDGIFCLWHFFVNMDMCVCAVYIYIYIYVYIIQFQNKKNIEQWWKGKWCIRVRELQSKGLLVGKKFSKDLSKELQQLQPASRRNPWIKVVIHFSLFYFVKFACLHHSRVHNDTVDSNVGKTSNAMVSRNNRSPPWVEDVFKAAFLKSQKKFVLKSCELRSTKYSTNYFKNSKYSWLNF